MPTGYTSGIGEGKIKTFKEFALLCSRAFGATIAMRDEPLDAKIPADFKVDSYHTKQLSEAQERLARIKKMSDAELDRETHMEFAASLERYNARMAEIKLTRERYEAFLAQAKGWTPPTAGHFNIKKFMIEQISDSIEWDCVEPEKPRRLSIEEWRKNAIDEAVGDIDYHSKEALAEQELVEGRNRWLKQLRESL
jgi:hypothetical protein